MSSQQIIVLSYSNHYLFSSFPAIMTLQFAASSQPPQPLCTFHQGQESDRACRLIKFDDTKFDTGDSALSILKDTQ